MCIAFLPFKHGKLQGKILLAPTCKVNWNKVLLCWVYLAYQVLCNAAGTPSEKCLLLGDNLRRKVSRNAFSIFFSARVDLVCSRVPILYRIWCMCRYLFSCDKDGSNKIWAEAIQQAMASPWASNNNISSSWNDADETDSRSGSTSSFGSPG